MRQLELGERKEKILKAIIQTYLETGEPVGSRTISKYSDLNLSSATIRNEMSDLEELGYIIQPHTSAGRIPSDKGYRFYVDQIIREKDDEVTEIKDLMIQRVDRVELLLKQLATILAANTNYATMISGPQYHQTKIKFIQLSRMEACSDSLSPASSASSFCPHNEKPPLHATKEDSSDSVFLAFFHPTTVIIACQLFSTAGKARRCIWRRPRCFLPYGLLPLSQARLP